MGSNYSKKYSVGDYVSMTYSCLNGGKAEVRRTELGTITQVTPYMLVIRPDGLGLNNRVSIPYADMITGAAKVTVVRKVDDVYQV